MGKYTPRLDDAGFIVFPHLYELDFDPDFYFKKSIADTVPKLRLALDSWLQKKIVKDNSNGFTTHGECLKREIRKK